MRFSERLGYKPVKEQLQIENIEIELRNSLWSVFLDSFLKTLSNTSYDGYALYEYCRALWFNFYKLPIDTAPIYVDSYSPRGVDKERLIKHLRKFFFEGSNWYDPYDLIEFSVKFADDDFINLVNVVLEREKSAYRFVNGQLTQITSKLEISEIEEALTKTDDFKAIKTHLNSALKLLADKQNPDYRNSIKESISAVESMCKIFTHNEKSTLGDALNQLERDGNLHPALKKAFSSLYGYTSDDAGIRHALVEGDREIDFHEAKFMLVTCSSFINYLTSRME